MDITGRMRRFFRCYRFDDFAPETREAIRQVEEYERGCREDPRHH